MTDISKEAVDALLQGVTGKAWKVRKGFQDDEVEIAPKSINGRTKPEVGQWGEIATVPIWTKDGKANARFIAAARELVPAQAAEIERMAAEENRLCAEIKRLGDLLVKAEAERDAANALLEAWVEVAEHCSIEEGVCCCGDNMDGHIEPMNCGHSPVDHGGYIARQLEETARAHLGAKP